MKNIWSLVINMQVTILSFSILRDNGGANVEILTVGSAREIWKPQNRVEKRNRPPQNLPNVLNAFKRNSGSPFHQNYGIFYYQCIPRLYFLVKIRLNATFKAQMSRATNIHLNYILFFSFM